MGTYLNDLTGTYLSEDENYEITITREDPNLGFFEGFLINKKSPLGEWRYELNDSNTRHAYLSGKKLIAVGIFPWYRSGMWDESVFEYWNGAYDAPTNKLTMGMTVTYTSIESGIQNTVESNIILIKR
ncbi:hypothetical protein [Citrobacter sp. FP75]|uniref:hypothetical protein n=1 Tax=Citrobacter sp. FP75 TaxID=1852949 RepID=UPI001BC9D257|nr:hypothetical protein [Citrobacter sp. FP75]